MQGACMEMDKVRLAQLYAALAEKLRGGKVESMRIEGDMAVFGIEVVKPHITYTETVELPVADWFLERYCFK